MATGWFDILGLTMPWRRMRIGILIIAAPRVVSATAGLSGTSATAGMSTVNATVGTR
jgi:hypothetical protein